MVILFHSTRTVSRWRPLHQGQTYTSQSKGQSNRRYSAQPLQEEEDAQPIIMPPFQHSRRVIEISTSSSTHTRRNHHLHSDEPKIGRLVLVRHGQSEWNVTDPSRNLTARFVSITYSKVGGLGSFVTLILPMSRMQTILDWMGRHRTHSAGKRPGVSRRKSNTIGDGDGPNPIQR
jgi:hypothetical protein